nr:unnamed protein product [Digitaria exilis]
MRSGQTEAVAEIKEAGAEFLRRGAEEQRICRDDGGDAVTGEADAREQGEDGVGAGGGVEAGPGEATGGDEVVLEAKSVGGAGEEASAMVDRGGKQVGCAEEREQHGGGGGGGAGGGEDERTEDCRWLRVGKIKAKERRP